MAGRLTTGYPAASAAEVQAFYRMVLALPATDLPSGLHMLDEHPVVASDISLELDRVEERSEDLAPNDFARLLLLLLRNSTGPVFLRNEVAVRDKLAQAIRREDVQAIRSTLIRLNQADLADRLIPVE
jgi:hypothetical protein